MIISDQDGVGHGMRFWELWSSFILTEINDYLHSSLWGIWESSSTDPWKGSSCNNWEFCFKATSISVTLFWYGPLRSVWNYLGQKGYWNHCLLFLFLSWIDNSFNTATYKASTVVCPIVIHSFHHKLLISREFVSAVGLK